MLADAQLLFSDDQELVTATATASTNIIDLGNDDSVVQAMNYKGCLSIVLIVTTAFTSDGAATLIVSLQSDDDSAFGSATTLYSTPAIAKTSLDAIGDHIRLGALPLINEQYVRLLYTTGTAAWTAGAIWAALLLDQQISGI